MKSLLLFFASILTLFTTHAQDIQGVYANKWLSNAGEGIEYTLALKPDGQFTFTYKRLYLDSNPDTEIEVKGTWDLDGHLLVLDTNDEAESENFVASGLDLNKARFVSVSPRHPNFNLVKPKLEFYESKVFYAKNMELIKTEASVTLTE